MLKLVTWNVNSVLARLERVRAYLLSHQPDILCLQELKCIEAKFPKDVFLEMGYHSVAYGQPTYNGVAVLSKEPITEIARGLAPHMDDPQARVLAVSTHGIKVVSAYIPNGQEVGSEKYAYKLKWLSAFLEFLKTNFNASDSLAVLGDFNIAPEDIDVHDPDLWRGKVLFSDLEKEALDKILAFGLKDTFRKHHPDEIAYSWWDYRALGFIRNHGLRIDFVLATTPLFECCTSAAIIREERKGEKPSDHAPVEAIFKGVSRLLVTKR